MMMAFGGICSASDGSDLNSEQKTAQLFIDAFGGENAPEYETLSRDFTDGLKNELTAARYSGLQRETKNNFGTLTQAKFFAYQRYDNSDVVIYYAGFDSNKAAQLVFVFDKNQKLIRFTLSPVNTQSQNEQ